MVMKEKMMINQVLQDIILKVEQDQNQKENHNYKNLTERDPQKNKSYNKNKQRNNKENRNNLNRIKFTLKMMNKRLQ